MPEKETMERAREDAREGKSPSSQAGEFVREEMHHIREGKHGAASTKQAIAIGLSKARRAGVKLEAPGNGKTSAKTAEQARRDYQKGQSHSSRKPSAKRSRATSSKKGRSYRSFTFGPFHRGASCREKKRGFGTPSFRHERKSDPAQGKLTQLVSVRRGLFNDSKTEDWQISFVFAQKER